jgi:lysophospholipase L1-like esterase
MKSGAADLAINRETLISRRTAALLLGAYLVGPVRALASTAPLTNEVVARSQLSTGDQGRLMRVFDRARRGEPITLGVIGGSITAGAFASTEQNSYPGRLLGWWRAQFPRCEIRLVNAGVGGTGSMYGALRVESDLLSSEPDFVVVEFAVNDNWTDGDAFEGLVRQILAQPNLPAVVLLFMMWERGGNDQAMQAKVGAHYNLPMVSFRDALWPEIETGRLKWQDYIVDTVHPTDAGHAAAARFITTLCDNTLRAVPARQPNAISALPLPLVSDAFQHVRWLAAAGLDPVKNDGWRLDLDERGIAAWNSAAASGSISFDWSGTGLVIVFSDPTFDPRRVRFSVDGASFQTLDALKQPKRPIVVLAQNLTPGRHIVELECIDYGSNGSAATDVRLHGIGSIGIAPDQR